MAEPLRISFVFSHGQSPGADDTTGFRLTIEDNEDKNDPLHKLEPSRAYRMIMVLCANNLKEMVKAMGCDCQSCKDNVELMDEIIQALTKGTEDLVEVEIYKVPGVH